MTTSQPRLYYRVQGDGAPLLAILGFATSSAILDPLAELYTTRMRAVTYDHPGTGRSSRAALPCTTASLAASAVRLLDELGIESAHIAGISLGGAIAQELALRFPHRVRGLILVATSAAGPLSKPPEVRAFAVAAAHIAASSARTRRLSLGPMFFSPGFLKNDRDRADVLLGEIARYPATPWGIWGQLLAAGLHDRYLDLPRIKAPTLVLAGDEDFLVPLANATRLADAIPDAELRVFAGGRHGFALERHMETFEAITEWLDRRRPTAAADPPSRAAASREQLTRQLAVPLGTLRVYRSLAVLTGRALGSLAGAPRP